MLWAWNEIKNKWDTIEWKAKQTPGTAIIVGSGLSVQKEVEYPPCSLKIVQNMAYQFVKPDIWIGMDKPKMFPQVFSTYDYPKICRGNMFDFEVMDTKVKLIPETYFMSMKIIPRESIFSANIFSWTKNTLVPSVQLAIWMGYKKIAFHGVDLKGNYADGRKLLAKTQKLLNQEYIWLKWLNGECKKKGIQLINLSGKDSRLSEFIDEN